MVLRPPGECTIREASAELFKSFLARVMINVPRPKRKPEIASTKRRRFWRDVYTTYFNGVRAEARIDVARVVVYGIIEALGT